MELVIHRGAKEIGGSCVELRSGGRRLILDLGLPLSNPDGTPFRLDRNLSVQELLGRGILPNIPGLYQTHEPDPNIALVISHAHQDHYGLAGFVHRDVPKFLSAGTQAILNVCRVFLPRPVVLNNTKILGNEKRIEPFTIRAFPVDHSAPDAVALAISDGKATVVYSGDLRGGGPRGHLFENLKRDLPRGPDAMLLEGTTLGRTEPVEFENEDDVREELKRIFRAKSNVAMVFCSGQNIGRLVSVYKAAAATRCTLILDPYTAYVLHALRDLSKSLPQHWWKRIRIIPWRTQERRLYRIGQDWFNAMINKREIHSAAIKENASRMVLLGRTNDTFEAIARKLDPRGMEIIWSMWREYWKNDRFVKGFCDHYGIEPRWIHAGGHASEKHLRELVAAVRPQRVVPIHTEQSGRYGEYFSNVVHVPDSDVLVL